MYDTLIGLLEHLLLLESKIEIPFLKVYEIKIFIEGH